MKIILAMRNRRRVYAFRRSAVMIVCAAHAHNRRGQTADEHRATISPGNRPPALLTGLDTLSSSSTSDRRQKNRFGIQSP